MFERWYKIMGITPAMLEAWGDDMRKDIIFYENEEGMVEAHIQLSLIEALWVKYQMYRNNKQKGLHYYFNLLKC